MKTKEEIDAEVVKFFEDKGFEVSWDFSARLGQTWHEITWAEGKIIQIDKGTPLEDILTDIPGLAAGNGGSSGNDYNISSNGGLDGIVEFGKHMMEILNK